MRSMTGFARTETQLDMGRMELELRSLNQRYLELNFHLPASLTHLEPIFRNKIRNRLHRGKVSITLRLTSSQKQEGLTVDKQRLQHLKAALETVEAEIIGIAQPTSLDLLQYPGVIASSEEYPDITAATAQSLFDEALTQLEESREREGARLHQIIQDKLASITSHVSDIRALMPQISERQRIQFESRAHEFGLSLDEHRLGAELALLVQRSDVEEELDRLMSHVSEVNTQLESTSPIGRRLDFLIQELNREANTIASKAVVKETTLHAVELKVLIEQAREQVQNIE